MNGWRDGVGADAGEFRALVAAGDRGTGGPVLSIAHGKVILGPGRAPPGGADVWLVRYDPRIEQVPVKRGENAGRTLPHRNVVRALVRLGRWTGAAETLTAPPGDPSLASAILVQRPVGGPILAAARG